MSDRPWPCTRTVAVTCRCPTVSENKKIMSSQSTFTFSRREEPKAQMLRASRRRVPGTAFATLSGEPKCLTRATGLSLELDQTSALCANSGCAYRCTGVVPGFCCRACSLEPGSHGPMCEKARIECGTQGCGFAVTKASLETCCNFCAQGKGHGPLCWMLSLEAPTRTSREEPSRVESSNPLNEDGSLQELENAINGNQQVIAENAMAIEKLEAQVRASTDG